MLCESGKTPGGGTIASPFLTFLLCIQLLYLTGFLYGCYKTSQGYLAAMGTITIINVTKRLVPVFIIFCIITINFILIRFMPGDPVVHIIGEDEYLRLEAEAPEVIEEVRREYGLDKPLPVQYITYLNKTLHLDFGNSYRTKLPVLETVLFRMRWTLLLTIPAIVLSSVLGGGLGLRAGWKKGGLLSGYPVAHGPAPDDPGDPAHGLLLHADEEYSADHSG